MVLLPFQPKRTIKNCNLRSKKPSSLKETYNFGAQLGKGGSAVVYECVSKSSRKSYACKILSKKKYHPAKIHQEIRMLSTFCHENIVRFHEFYESKYDVYIVMQNAKGGELFQVLREHGKFDEVNAQIVLKALLEAVLYLQSKNTVHRDIKLENVLFRTRVLDKKRLTIESEDVLLVDFGLAKTFTSPKERTKTRCGSKYYVAPEVWLGRGYGVEADLWSIGVVMFMMLTNTPPFFEETRHNLETSIMCGSYTVPSTSVKSRILLKQLLTLNPSKRITPTLALENSWFGIDSVL